MPQPVQRLGRQVRHAGQFGVRLVVAGQQRQRDAVLAAGLGQLLDPVGPVAPPAQQPRDNQLRVSRDFLDIEIDGQVMAEMQQAGEPQARRVRILRQPPNLGLRQAGDFGVGGGQEDDVARRLAEIDGLRPVLDSPRLCGKKMHGPLRKAKAARRATDKRSDHHPEPPTQRSLERHPYLCASVSLW